MVCHFWRVSWVACQEAPSPGRFAFDVSGQEGGTGTDGVVHEDFAGVDAFKDGGTHRLVFGQGGERFPDIGVGSLGFAVVASPPIPKEPWGIGKG